MRRAKHSLGFTLVELLVVITIVTVLATIVWKANAGLSARSALQGQQRVFEVLGDAVTAYLEVYPDYPAQPQAPPKPVNPLDDLEQALLKDNMAPASEVLYAALASHIDSRRLLSRLHRGCVTDLPRNDGTPSNLMPELRDVWGTILFYQSTKSFPLFVSAGPDMRFGTVDDLHSK